jgi:two-component system, OmpR family, response regulator ChvI
MKIKNNENKKKFLIVDDDPDICVTLTEIFKQNGFIADSSTDPLLALDNFKAGLYDLLLLDIKMPEMNGFQLHQEIKKIDETVKICFLSAGEVWYARFRKEKGFCALDKELILRKPIENTDSIKQQQMLNKKGDLLPYGVRSFGGCVVVDGLTVGLFAVASTV